LPSRAVIPTFPDCKNRCTYPIISFHFPKINQLYNKRHLKSSALVPVVEVSLSGIGF
jgi:hypothetical protein